MPIYLKCIRYLKKLLDIHNSKQNFWATYYLLVSVFKVSINDFEIVPEKFYAEGQIQFYVYGEKIAFLIKKKTFPSHHLY